MMRLGFSWSRMLAVFIKECQQMLRDRMTFAMALGIPVMQLVLFGFVINTNPKSLPTAIVSGETGPMSRSLLSAMQSTGYFHIMHRSNSPAQADALMARGEVQFIITLPPHFEQDLVRGQRPALLVAADATDPSASGNAMAALNTVAAQALRHDLNGPLATLKPAPAPFETRIHLRYNPESLSRYHIVPGLVGVILTMTMVMLTGLAMTRERERGTMENLLATPVTPAEVMVGKILPYVVMGYAQLGIILVAARVLFDVPMIGSLWLLISLIGIFIIANLGVGFTFSTLARNQLQAMQMTFFFFLPSMLLSGFMFPFKGMPSWAQTIGEVLPLTHFLRIVRGILLKGSTLTDVLPDVWPMVLFLLASCSIALLRYRRTLD